MDGTIEATAAPEKISIQAQTFVCNNCGGTLRYDIDAQKFRCASCKAESTIETLSDTVREYDFSSYAERESQSTSFDGIAVAHCQNCGYEITFDTSEIATICPMCASTQIAAVKQQAGIPPEGIIPFQIDKANAAQAFRKWVKSRWFAPNDFKKKCNEGALKGIYLPFWTYDANAIATYSGRGGRTHIVKDKDGKTRTETTWYPVSGAVSDSFDDVLVCASKQADDINDILPFNTVEKTVPYSSSYLSGFQAELYTLKADTAFETAKELMEKRLKDLAEQDIKRHYDKADVNRLISKFTEVTYKHVLLPVWSSTFGYKAKSYKYFVNGETGEVSGQRPYSVPKIILAIVLGLAVVAGIFYLFNR